jgi:hypothetical protein
MSILREFEIKNEPNEESTIELLRMSQMKNQSLSRCNIA